MKTSKFYFFLALVICVSMSLMACYERKTVKKPAIYLLLKTADNPFFREIEKGVKENCAQKYKLEVRAGKNESDVKYQSEMLQAILSKAKQDTSAIAGIIITPSTSGSGLIEFLKEFYKLKIPVVIVDSKIDEKILVQAGIPSLPYIGSSNVEGGKQAANFLTSKIAEGKILILNGVQGQGPAHERYEGFMQGLRSKKGKYKITVKVANWRRSESIEVVSGLYSFGSTFDAVFAANDEMAMGAYQALKDINVNPMPLIIGFDAIDEARRAIIDKKIGATIAQNPYRMGRSAVQMVDKIIAGEKIQTLNIVETELIK